MKNKLFKGSVFIALGASCYAMLATLAKMAYQGGFYTAEITLSQFILGFAGLLLLNMFRVADAIGVDGPQLLMNIAFPPQIINNKIRIMKNSFKLPQLLLRLALGIGFLVTVSDRLGFLGPFGTRNIEWGNWDSFINYTGTLMPFLDKPAVNILGGIATLAEAVIGILLIIGFKTRTVAIGSCLLTLVFAFTMSVFLGIKAPINFAVFPVSAASLLLATIPVYDWSIDNFFAVRHAINK